MRIFRIMFLWSLVSFLGAIGSRACDGGVDCEIVANAANLVSWVCVPGDTPYLYCANVDRERLCLLFGDACDTAIPISDRGAWVAATLWVADAGNFSSLPRIAPVTTVSGVKDEIAAIGGVDRSAVHLRGRMYFAGLGPLILDSTSFLVRGAGFTIFSAPAENGLTHLRVCGHSQRGGDLSIIADLLTLESETVLVRLPSLYPPVILAFRAETPLRAEWRTRLVDLQTRFENDVQTELESPIAGITLGTGSATCRP